jgi:hypothetical protein
MPSYTSPPGELIRRSIVDTCRAARRAPRELVRRHAPDAAPRVDRVVQAHRRRHVTFASSFARTCGCARSGSRAPAASREPQNRYCGPAATEARAAGSYAPLVGLPSQCAVVSACRAGRSSAAGNARRRPRPAAILERADLVRRHHAHLPHRLVERRPLRRIAPQQPLERVLRVHGARADQLS